ncbi:acyl carrier protein [Streptomyces spectabilis]|uniref:Acyl carrier protein n=1 Tax=Streptomyces spectabilis TaxID=68270 RepID=A0A5P2X3A8_STRST|nr:acyl carrier protein [Streptomyces spectabilis]
MAHRKRHRSRRRRSTRRLNHTPSPESLESLESPERASTDGRDRNVSGNRTAGVDLEDLRALVAEELELPLDDVTDDADLKNELDVDSLTAMEVAVQIEKKYRIKIDEEEIKTLTTLTVIHRIVSAKVGAA